MSSTHQSGFPNVGRGIPGPCGACRGPECSEARAVVFEKIICRLQASIGRTSRPRMEQRPTLIHLQKWASETRTICTHDGEWKGKAERKEEQRVSGTAIFGQPGAHHGLAHGIRYGVRRSERDGVLRGGERSLARMVVTWNRLRTMKGGDSAEGWETPEAEVQPSDRERQKRAR